MTRLKIILASIVGALALALLALYFSGLAPAAFAAMVIDSFRTANDPPGTLVVERRESRAVVATSGVIDPSPRERATRRPVKNGGRASMGRSPRSDSHRSARSTPTRFVTSESCAPTTQGCTSLFRPAL